MPAELSIAIVASVVVTGMLAGLCWTVQVVVYPQFTNVPPAHFAPYHAAHTRWIARVVAPLMLAELTLAVWIVFVPGLDREIAWALLLLTALVWASTGAVQVPLHSRLERDGTSATTIARLIRTNWIRTLAWSARLAVLAWVVAGELLA